MHGSLYGYSENLVFNIAVRSTFVPHTHHLLQILRCAAPSNFLMAQPYLASTTAKAAARLAGRGRSRAIFMEKNTRTS